MNSTPWRRYSTDHGDRSSPAISPQSTTFSYSSAPAPVQGRYLGRLPQFDVPPVRRIFTSSRLQQDGHGQTSPTDETPLLSQPSSPLKQLDEDEAGAVIFREGVGARGYEPGTMVAHHRPLRPPTPMPPVEEGGSHHGGGKGGAGGKLIRSLSSRISSVGSHAAGVIKHTRRRSSFASSGGLSGGRRGSGSSSKSGGNGNCNKAQAHEVAQKWGWTWLAKEKRWERRRRAVSGLSVEGGEGEGEGEGGAGPAYR